MFSVQTGDMVLVRTPPEPGIYPPETLKTAIIVEKSATRKDVFKIILFENGEFTRSLFVGNWQMERKL